MGKYKIVTIILLLIVIVETGMLLQQPVSTIQSFDDSSLREDIIKKNKSIRFLEQKVSDLYIGIDSLKKEYEVYDSIEPEIKHHYHEIYIDIKHASNAKLDSLLRSNW